MNILDLISKGSYKLKNNSILSYRLDSEILLSKVLEKSRERVIIDQEEKVCKERLFKFNILIKRRSRKEPIAYILNEKEFWSKKFLVNKNTLIPRPETELMVEKLVEINKGKSISILDAGTGSGCIIISLLSELKNASGIGIDICRKAVLVAKKNAKFHSLTSNLKFYCKPVQKIFNKKFDLVVSNPPYIQSRDIRDLDEDVKNYEPLVALDGGNDGLDVIKKVIYKAKEILKINGMLAIEIGKGQSKKVSKILNKNKFTIVYRIKDFKNNIRCIISKLKR